jgi:nitroimidazol reductase NimA-like FMN-containing flavoprotein (pyridoxamine 5'-phosphate oxidase superfamily)
MTDGKDLAAIARAIIDASLYMVLGTADETGRPWVTPVYYASAGYRDFFWVSVPGAKHSRNLEVRPELSIAIFDSSVPVDTGQCVYMSAVARELAGDERAEPLDIFSRRGLGHGGRAWTLADVQAPARHRLYQASAVDQYVLDEHDERVPVTV